MESDVFGNPLPPPRPASTAKKETPIERATAKRLDRTARFYEHMAPPAHAHETAWRHSRWKAKRALVRRSLASTGTAAVTLANFDACGSTAISQWSETAGRRRLSAFYCRCRHCEPCARSKANKIAANLREKLLAAGRHDYRLTTLTLRHVDEPLLDQIRRLYACFKKLRRLPEWKKTQEGGAAVLEVKLSPTGWHVHLHCVVHGRFIDKHQLSAAWKKVTGDSFIVDVRCISRAEDAAAYVCKYITKSTDDSVWLDPQKAAEFVIGTKGVRTVNTFGSWRKFPLLKCSNQPTDWVSEDSLVSLLSRAKTGDRIALDILTSLKPPPCYEDLLHHPDRSDGHLVDPPGMDGRLPAP